MNRKATSPCLADSSCVVQVFEIVEIQVVELVVVFKGLSVEVLNFDIIAVA